MDGAVNSPAPVSCSGILVTVIFYQQRTKLALSTVLFYLGGGVTPFMSEKASGWGMCASEGVDGCKVEGWMGELDGRKEGRRRGGVLESVSCSPNSQLLSAEQVHKASLEGFWRGAAG